MRVIGLPSRISGRAFLDGEHCAFHVDAEDESERLFRGAQAARSRPAPDQPRRGGLSDLGGFVCDLSGPPAAVGVLDGGSLAGKDSSSSSSSFSSGFDCGLIGDDSRRLRGFPVLSSGLNSRSRERCRSQALSH